MVLTIILVMVLIMCTSSYANVQQGLQNRDNVKIVSKIILFLPLGIYFEGVNTSYVSRPLTQISP